MKEGQSQPDSNNPSLTTLALSFFRLGLTCFGGPAIIAYIRKLVVEQKGWMHEDVFLDGVEICHTIPGSTAVQNAGYVGLKLRGLPGATICFVAFFLPAFIIMMGLSALYLSFHSLPAVVSAFNGLQAIIVAIVANATISFGLTSLRTYRDIIVTAVSAIAFFIEVNPALVIVLAGLLGLVLYRIEGLPAAKRSSLKRPYTTLQFGIILAVTAAIFGLLFFLDRQLFDLTAVMSWINIFAYGGGYAALPLMYHEIVVVRSWMDSHVLMNGIALGQVTPGPFVITATFIGYMIRGPLGAIVSTIGMFLPSFIILVFTTPYYDNLRRSALFNRAIAGILCSFVGILLSTTMHFAFDVPWEPIRIALAVVSLTALLFRIDILYVVLVGTIIAILVL